MERQTHTHRQRQTETDRGKGGETEPGERGKRLASVRHVICDQELDPNESDKGRSLFLLSPGCDRNGYYRAAHGMGSIPNEIQFPCRTLGTSEEKGGEMEGERKREG